MKNNKVIFLGYLWPLIKALNSMEKVSLVCVGLEPNRIATNATRVLCNYAGIKTFDASKIRSNKLLDRLLNKDIDLVVVGGFGQILDKKILNLPTKGIINFHPSLLPAYKGGSPIEEMLIRGDKKGGVTLHWMSEKIDEGSIIANASIIIENDDDYISLLDKCLKKGGYLLRKIFSIDFEDWPSIDQLSNSKIFSPRKEIDGLIDWGEDASYITRLCNALGWRGWVKTHIRGQEIIIRKTKVVIDDKPNKPGKVIQLDPNLIVRCGINSLEIKEASIPPGLILGDVLSTKKQIS